MKKINLGIIGFGEIAKIHYNNIKSIPKVKICSISSKIDTKDTVPKEIAFYSDYKKMIKEQNIDTVLIATPTHTHKDIACFCSENGLNIFLEKPMTNRLEDCDSILDSIKENKVKLQVGHVIRFWPTYGSVRDYLFNNPEKIGEVQSLLAKRLGTFPWSPWFADQKKSGGVILDLSIHDVDYAIWLLGGIDNVVSISCEAKKIRKYDMDVYGKSTINITLKGDKKAICEASWAKPEDFQFLTYMKIQGSKNHIEFDGAEVFSNNLWNIQNSYSSNDGYYNQLEYFFHSILGMKNELTSMNTGIDGKNAVKICLGAINSADNNGTIIHIDEIE